MPRFWESSWALASCTAIELKNLFHACRTGGEARWHLVLWTNHWTSSWILRWAANYLFWVAPTICVGWIAWHWGMRMACWHCTRWYSCTFSGSFQSSTSICLGKQQCRPFSQWDVGTGHCLQHSRSQWLLVHTHSAETFFSWALDWTGKALCQCSQLQCQLSFLSLRRARLGQSWCWCFLWGNWCLGSWPSIFCARLVPWYAWRTCLAKTQCPYSRMKVLGPQLIGMSRQQPRPLCPRHPHQSLLCPRSASRLPPCRPGQYVASKFRAAASWWTAPCPPCTIK